MKISKKERKEIDFLSKWGEFEPTQEEMKGFILKSRLGKGKHSKFVENRLTQAKRRYNLTLKMWENDIREGLLFYCELLEEFDSPYFLKTTKRLSKIIPDTTWYWKDRIEKLKIQNLDKSKKIDYD